MGLVGGLAVVAGGVRLPGLVEGLEVEGVDAPVEGTAAGRKLLVTCICHVKMWGGHLHSLVVVGLCVLSAGLCAAVVVTAVGGPASLAVPELEAVERALDVLDVAQSLLEVIEVGLDSAVADVVALPVSESVGKEELDAAVDESISSAVGELVPGIGGTNGSAGESVSDVVDLLEELLACEVAAVEGLGADGHGVDLVLVLGNVGGESLLVRLEALIGVRPDTEDDLEALALGRGQDLLGGVAVAGGIAADELAAGLLGDGVEVLLVVGLVFAGTVGVLGAEGETELALGGCEGSRSGGEGQRGEGCNAHVGECSSGRFK